MRLIDVDALCAELNREIGSPQGDEKLMKINNIITFASVLNKEDILNQTAKVMKTCDFYGEDFGYLEYRPSRPGWGDFEPYPVLIAGVNEDDDLVMVMRKSGSGETLDIRDMNRTWRIWKGYPSHLRLIEVKWDG